jgi:peptidoglycan/xylan/chitin deacetylase (PgdA/CDA1 family)
MAKSFWPDGARLVISISMQFEAGAQPERNPYSPYVEMDPESPNPPVQSWFAYGVKEGIPRLLDLWDRKKIKVTSHVVGQAAERAPALAREIAERGHEIAGHGMTWEPHWRWPREKERESYEASANLLEKITGQRPVGFNAFALRGSPNALEILQELGYLYHIDNISRDEPFFVTVKGKPFGVVPYTRRNNDIERFHIQATTAEMWMQDVRDEMGLLYAEAEKKRRMLSISVHDRIGGQPARVAALERFIDHAQKQPGVVFMRKVDIINWAAKQPDTPRES